MSRLVKISIVIAAVAILSVAASRGPEQVDTETGCQQLRQALQNYQQLKVGLPRSDATTFFVLDGGMQFPSSARYVDPRCKYLHVDVEFELAKPDAISPSPDDRIKSISKLYVEYPAKD
jgi:hypothetical protein